ncbi:MAG: inorganic phosphate transporter, partial [Acidobacteriota bacterium]
MLGMLGSLLAAGIWLHMCTMFGLPVSTTHSIVGAVAGFGIVQLGMTGLHWGKVITITVSWIISPFLGAILAFVTFWFILKFIIDTRHPRVRVRMAAPFLVGLVAFILTLSMVFKGLKNLHLDLNLWESLLVALGVAAACTVVSALGFGRIKIAAKGNHFGFVERNFRYLQIVTACYVAFAHGANDNANAVGPMAAVISLWRNHEVMSKVPIPVWVLALGGVGIVIGLGTLGYKVMATVGEKITELTPSRGFSAEFGAATTVLVASKMGLPISTTHTLVGAVIGVGLARGLGLLNLRVLRDIVVSWFLTLPAAALISAGIYLLLRAAF